MQLNEVDTHTTYLSAIIESTVVSNWISIAPVERGDFEVCEYEEFIAFDSVRTKVRKYNIFFCINTSIQCACSQNLHIFCP